MSDLVDDTTPQLGGNLDVNGFTVDGRDPSADGTKLDGIASGADVSPVASVNTQTGAVVLDPDDLDDSATTHRFTSASDISKLAGIEAGAEVNLVDSVNGQTGAVSLDPDDLNDAATTNKFTTSADISKLAGIETGATADQSDAEIKTAYENNANTNAFTDAEQTKLSGIETSATADQTGAEIKAAYEAEADTNAFTDADHTKLDGIATGATANARSATSIFEAALSSATQNCNGTTGSTSDFTWTATTNNATYITSFTGGDSEIVITSAGEYVVDAALVVLNSATNNRHTILGTVLHLNSSDVQQWEHHIGAMYIRDDAATYDSGAVAGQQTIYASAGDKIILRRTVLDTQDSTGNCYADQSSTVIRILKID